MTKTLASDQNDLGTRLDTLELQVGDLNAKSGPWYKKASTLISLFALLFSLVAFGYTIYRDRANDKDQKSERLHSALAGLISQLNSLTLQSIETVAKYREHPDISAAVSGAYQSHVSVIATNAYTLLLATGKAASPFDAMVIANALQAVGDFGDSEKALTFVLPLSQTPTEYLIVARTLGALKLYQGRLPEANEYYKKAIEVSMRFQMSQDEIDNYNMQTEIYWATAAASQKRCELAHQHAKAKKLQTSGTSNNIFATSLSADQVNLMVDLLEQQVSIMCPN
jgi:tetratricopeptide (TPR) repeat protein